MVRESRKASEYWHLDTKNDRSLSWFGGDPLGCLYHGNGQSIDALDGIIDGGNTVGRRHRSTLVAACAQAAIVDAQSG